jgi:hypothetical protein
LIIGEAYKGNQNAKRMLAFAPLFTTLHRVLKTAELEERLKKLESQFSAQYGKADHSEGSLGLPISQSAAFQTLLPLCGSPGIHRLKRPVH